MKHTCHWPGCNTAVPPAIWGCKAHWFKLPKTLRDGIWKAYRPGQEIDKQPSQEYLAVAAMVQAWIRGDMTVNKDGSIVVHKDIPVPRTVHETSVCHEDIVDSENWCPQCSHPRGACVCAIETGDSQP